jgi:hypothetical protein
LAASQSSSIIYSVTTIVVTSNLVRKTRESDPRPPT